jgi:hypothetical protein
VTGTDPATNPTSLVWDLAWNGRYVYVFDMDRGIEVLRLKEGTSAAEASSTPSVQSDPNASVPVSSLEKGALVCPGFKRARS